MSNPDTGPSPTPPDPSTQTSTGRGCAAVALIVIGALILVPSGLCTAIMGAGALFELFTNPSTFMNDLSDIWSFAIGIVLVAGIGFALIYAGNQLRKGG